jgi:hypothetical protein
VQIKIQDDTVTITLDYHTFWQLRRDIALTAWTNAEDLLDAVRELFGKHHEVSEEINDLINDR